MLAKYHMMNMNLNPIQHYKQVELPAQISKPTDLISQSIPSEFEQKIKLSELKGVNKKDQKEQEKEEKIQNMIKIAKSKISKKLSEKRYQNE